MPVYHQRSTKKPSGGRTRPHEKKELNQRGREFIGSHVADEDKQVNERSRGANQKTRVRKAHTANLADPETGDVATATITDVVENPANQEFVRRKIVTKGAVIDTEDGEARVTSRPNQDGTVNAVLLD